MVNASPGATNQAPPVRAVAVGKAFGHSYDFVVASPRTCEVTNGKVRLKLTSGRPAVITQSAGSGRTYLLGFCVQDTYSQTYRDGDPTSRNQLCSLISDLFRDAKVQPRIHSSNPDIEASVRANTTEGYVFLINHESSQPQATVRLADIGFKIKQMMDVESGEPVPFLPTRDGVEFTTTASFGSTRLLRISP
jgi:hypothetical protein